MKTGLISLIFCKSLICATIINNPFKITDLAFDSVNFSFKMSWCIDSTGIKSGISGGISVNCNQPLSVRPETFFLPTSTCGDTVLYIPDLNFDTTYTIELWGRHNENWLQPETSSTKRIRVYSLLKQPVSFFDPSKSTDTVTALNGKVVLWKESDYLIGIPPHDDTVFYYKPSTKQLAGFVQIGTGIKFANPEPSLPFFIALSIDSIPHYCKPEQVHVYRDSAGLLIPERSSELYLSGNFVKIKTSNIKYPLIVLADTLLPRHKIISRVSSVIDSTPLNDTVEISDNSANITWSFFCAPGGVVPTKPLQSGLIGGTSGKVVCRIPSSGAQVSGVRALLVISDGSHTDTVNLSKCGIRSNSDPYTTFEKIIMPVSITANLDNSDMANCLNSLFGSQKEYNKSEFRIYRWASEPGSSNNAHRWIEYDKKYNSLFQAKPGILFWLISSKSQLINFGKGMTVPLNKPYTITLSPKNWTDCSNPFGFDLKLSDIFDSSVPDADKIHIYSWKPALAKKTYSASLMYSISVTDKSHDTIGANGNGYTIYNPFDKPLNLQLQPYPYGYTSRSLSKVKYQNGFSIKVTLQSGEDSISSVYCCGHSFSNDTLFCPRPPSFSGPYLSINKSDNQSYGILSYPINNSSLFVFEINRNDYEQFSPASVSAQFLDPTDSQREMMVLCKDQQTSSSSSVYLKNWENDNIRILVGSSSDINAFMNKTSSIIEKVPTVKHYFRNRQLFMSMDGISQKQCIIELFNLQGKYMAKREWFSGNDHGLQSISLPASGTYIVKISFKCGNFINHSIIQRISCL